MQDNFKITSLNVHGHVNSEVWVTHEIHERQSLENNNFCPTAIKFSLTDIGIMMIT